MHLTLVFLGEVTDEFVCRAEPELSAACAASSPFRGALRGLGAFPDPRRARVVWAGMSDGRQEMVGLQASVVAALRRVGFEPERRKFSPHLTLGRLRTPGTVSAVCEREFATETFDVDRAVLYRSVLTPSGPEYARLAALTLGQSSA
jgi:2'-5' RNA ligase